MTETARNQPLDFLKLMRPKQWLKNVFVFIGLFFGTDMSDPLLILKVVVVAIAFSLTSSSVYIFNDIIDIEKDRNHPKKSKRPLAAGKVEVNPAFILAIILSIISILLGYWVSWEILVILVSYVILNIFYSCWLKHVVILDVFCISAGFMLRILAGTVGVGIPPSKWLLFCSMMITLLLGFAKRRAELIALQKNSGEHREVLSDYSPALLDELGAICGAATIISYSLYTMSPISIEKHHTESLIYTVPFVTYAIFRYLFLLHKCRSGGDPTEDLFTDPHILIACFGWLATTLYLII